MSYPSINATRKKNANALLARWGDKNGYSSPLARLAEQWGKDYPYCHALLAPASPRILGDKAARSLEQFFNAPQFYLDWPHEDLPVLFDVQGSQSKWLKAGCKLVVFDNPVDSRLENASVLVLTSKPEGGMNCLSSAGEIMRFHYGRDDTAVCMSLKTGEIVKCLLSDLSPIEAIFPLGVPDLNY